LKENLLNKNSYALKINDKLTTFVHKGSHFVPPFKRVTSVSVIPFTKEGLVVAVRLRNRGLDIPGGHVEKNEKTPEETLHREVMEEAHMLISKPQLVEVIETDYFGQTPEEASYLLIYTAFVDKLLGYKTTDKMSYERVILSKEDFLNQYTSGDKRLMGKTIDSAATLLFLHTDKSK